MAEQKTVIAPMLVSTKMYSNFWGGINQKVSIHFSVTNTNFFHNNQNDKNKDHSSDRDNMIMTMTMMRMMTTVTLMIVRVTIMITVEKTINTYYKNIPRFTKLR